MRVADQDRPGHAARADQPGAEVPVIRSFAERDPLWTGILGTVAVALVLALAVGAGTVLFPGTRRYADFRENTGLRAGDDVVVAGLVVGSVRTIELRDDHVEVAFQVDDDRVRVGDRSTAEISAQSALGRKQLLLRPAGAGDDERIPLARTKVPYDLAVLVQDAGTQLGQLDAAQLAKALDTLSETFADTPAQFRSTLDGLRRLSETLNARDAALADLLRHADGVSSILAARNQQILELIRSGSVVLAELNSRQRDILALLANADAAIDQINGLVADQREQLRPALNQLLELLRLLEHNRQQIHESITRLGPALRAAGEAVGSGPFGDIGLANFPPTDLIPLLPELLARRPR
ncbi:MCE family protein [Pseudonocardiaceae bacterium YIM PH 21723]|nr:MCE family protein [Pseudonocardiaceae bacterium YIM PH 21723]